MTKGQQTAGLARRQEGWGPEGSCPKKTWKGIEGAERCMPKLRGWHERSLACSRTLKPWHQGRHLRLSCLSAVKSPACALLAEHPDLHIFVSLPWKGENEMVQPKNSPSFANL